MPAFRKLTVLEITRGVKAFFTLAAGITRGEVPDPVTLQNRLQVQTQKLVQVQRRVEKQRQQIQYLRRSAPVSTERTKSPERTDSGVTSAGINPQNMVWILGSPRTGSTWLSEILADPKG